MKWFQGWLHNWISVFVPMGEALVPPRHEVVYSFQCDRCGLLRHRVAPLRVRSGVITYQPINKHGSMDTWRWHYPDDWRRCEKLKEVVS